MIWYSQFQATWLVCSQLNLSDLEIGELQDLQDCQKTLEMQGPSLSSYSCQEWRRASFGEEAQGKSKGEKLPPNIGLKKRPQVQTWAEVQVGSLSKPVHLTLVISIFVGYTAKGKNLPGNLPQLVALVERYFFVCFKISLTLFTEVSSFFSFLICI